MLSKTWEVARIEGDLLRSVVLLLSIDLRFLLSNARNCVRVSVLVVVDLCLKSLDDRVDLLVFGRWNNLVVVKQPHNFNSVLQSRQLLFVGFGFVEFFAALRYLFFIDVPLLTLNNANSLFLCPRTLPNSLLQVKIL